MPITDILTPSRTVIDAEASSKKRALEKVSSFISEDIPSLNASSLFKSLIAREKLGSTAIGQGIAIPHCRLQHCQHIAGALVRLTAPVDFDAMDEEPVDLLFVLLVPDEACEEHLQVLGQLARLFSDEDCRSALRSATSSEAMYEIAVAFDRKMATNPEHNARDLTS